MSRVMSLNMKSLSFKSLFGYITLVFIIANISTMLVTTKFIKPNNNGIYLYY